MRKYCLCHIDQIDAKNTKNQNNIKGLKSGNPVFKFLFQHGLRNIPAKRTFSKTHLSMKNDIFFCFIKIDEWLTFFYKENAYTFGKFQ